MPMLSRIFLLLVIGKIGTGFEYFISNVSGEIEKGNFVYYSMPYDGTILLELTSISGDCDLYVSQNTKKPSYEPESNCLSSSTCGVDSVIIPKRKKYNLLHKVSNYDIPRKMSWIILPGETDEKLVDLLFKRPVGIGIFGHPSHEICSYNLIFYRIDDSRDIFHFDPYAETLQTEMNKQLYEQTTDSSTSDNEEESLLWVFLRSVVVFLIEIIL